ncbi:hypothetical protein AVEN_193086-1 [Araneus ventricosus]|uniref:Uncharacterized protein n=1 Tax=Araneus ventricosus TaxID=182803 RepID=A0A4Y2B2W5_ARAVE|nr:hypothetical protein AVEN_193086-1 [Araneus ventricosus]
MVKISRRQHFAFHDPEIVLYIRKTFCQDFWVSHWKRTVPINPGVQACEVNIFGLSIVVQFDGVGASTKESVSRIKFINDMVMRNKGFEALCFLQ